MRHEMTVPGRPCPGRNSTHDHVESVTRNLGAFTAVEDVGFTAEAGRVTGFLGPDDAGR